MKSVSNVDNRVDLLAALLGRWLEFQPATTAMLVVLFIVCEVIFPIFLIAIATVPSFLYGSYMVSCLADLSHLRMVVAVMEARVVSHGNASSTHCPESETHRS